MLDESQKALEVGRDYHWRISVNHQTLRTGGTISGLYSSLDMEDDLRRLGAGSTLIEGTRGRV